MSDVLWSISSDRSMKLSSRRVSVSHCRQRVSLTNQPWKMSCTHVGCCCCWPGVGCGLLLLPGVGCPFSCGWPVVLAAANGLT